MNDDRRLKIYKCKIQRIKFQSVFRNSFDFLLFDLIFHQGHEKKMKFPILKKNKEKSEEGITISFVT